jgi:hypothetical protein
MPLVRVEFAAASADVCGAPEIRRFPARFSG